MTSSPVLYPDTDQHISAPVTVRLLGRPEYGGHQMVSARLPLQAFTLMASRPNAVATMADLARELWPADVPRSFVQTIHSYVMRIRARFDEIAGEDGFGKKVIITVPDAGYKLRLPNRLDVDSHRFDYLVAQARREMADGQLNAALDTLTAGFSLWRGAALEGVYKGPLLAAYAAGVEERRVTALLMRIDIDMRSGRHRDVVDELAEWFRGDRTRQDVAERLMLALYRSRRVAESLQAFAQLRCSLVEEHGIEPCAELQSLQQQILRGDASLELNGETR